MPVKLSVKTAESGATELVHNGKLLDALVNIEERVKTCHYSRKQNLRIQGAPPMPVYVYEVILPDGSAGESFEVLQNMSEPALSVHPDTGRPVRRALTAPNVTGKWSESGMNAKLSDKNLAEKGFTKYVKAGDGRYEKTTGKGPDTISADGVG